MTKDTLRSLSEADLRMLADQQGVIVSEEMDREDLIDSIVDAFEESRIERLDSDNWTIQSETKKFDIFKDEIFSLGGDLIAGGVPSDSKVRVILVNPLMAFVFWEIGKECKNIAKMCSADNGLFLRVHEKKLDGTPAGFFDIPVRMEDSKWYITLPSNGCRYYVDLMMRTPCEVTLATSNAIDSPRKITKDILGDKSLFRDDFLVLAGVYGFYDDDGSGDNTQKVVSFLDTGFVGDGR